MKAKTNISKSKTREILVKLEPDLFQSIRSHYWDTSDHLMGFRSALRKGITATDSSSDKEVLEELLAEVSYIVEKYDSLLLGKWI